MKSYNLHVGTFDIYSSDGRLGNLTLLDAKLRASGSRLRSAAYFENRNVCEPRVIENFRV